MGNVSTTLQQISQTYEAILFQGAIPSPLTFPHCRAPSLLLAVNGELIAEVSHFPKSIRSTPCAGGFPEVLLIARTGTFHTCISADTVTRAEV